MNGARPPFRTNKCRSLVGRPWVDCSQGISIVSGVERRHFVGFAAELQRTLRWKTIS